ncbi:hypothetical protein [Lutibacter sp.]|uniref:hypothetical protein n=1 Tax=Lutibacter sp. TaxID=1925666 RepID=UPI0027353AA3|nr:hypothetical protein [Lutibacter sp.]MDP3312387.1 hypothetical protein [Lutibacter sp.]
MKFQTETELVNILIETLKGSFRQDYVEIFEEVSLGYGIADLVLSSLIKPRIKLKSSKIVLNNSDINIYNLIKKTENISFDTILNTTKRSKKDLSKSIEKLVANKYVKIKGVNLVIDRDYELSFNENFAIEAKLKDWKRALKQAYRYKWFAEYSYVVMDAYYSSSAIKNIDTFEKYNVGLATITTDGDLKMYFNPKRQQPFDPKMQILFSEKIKNNYEFAR